ncbi:unnamed protein product [Merluccius merluccius]
MDAAWGGVTAGPEEASGLTSGGTVVGGAERQNSLRLDHSLQHVLVHIAGSIQVIHRGHCVNCSLSSRNSHNLVDHGAPEVLDLVSTSHTIVPQVHQLAHRKRCNPDTLIMSLFTSASCSQQLPMSTLKSDSKSGSMFSNPVLYLTRHWILNTTKEEVHQKTRLLPKHQVKR